MGDFNYPDICWKNNTAAHISSIKFLECVEDCFLIQMLDVPTRNEALLDLLLTNQENLLCNISISDSLGCSDHNIVEFGILLSTLKASTKTKVLDFRRANFIPLRAQLGGILWGFWKLLWGMKELTSAGSFSRALSWKHKNSSSPLKVREVGGARDSLGLTASF